MSKEAFYAQYYEQTKDYTSDDVLTLRTAIELTDDELNIIIRRFYGLKSEIIINKESESSITLVPHKSVMPPIDIFITGLIGTLKPINFITIDYEREIVRTLDDFRQWSIFVPWREYDLETVIELGWIKLVNNINF